jgi:nicotinate-nucleotide adenylyltransferase
VFDPPHAGHVALVREAKTALGLERVVVIVVAEPGHKDVLTPADVRLALARAAFPDDEVVLDEHPRTIDMLRAHPEWHGAVFLLGADELSSFLRWKEPLEVAKLVDLGVATRPNSKHSLSGPVRATFFELDVPAASTDIRARIAAGEDVRGVIPAAVWDIIERDGLYGSGPRYTESA